MLLTSAEDKNIKDAKVKIPGNSTSTGIKKKDETKDEGKANLNTLEKEEEKEKELVRFQYDGILGMDIEIPNDRNTCSDIDTLHYGTLVKSLFVLDYMSQCLATVKLKYVLNQIEESYYDVLDSDLKLNIENQLGVDTNEGLMLS